jgi:tRNA U34 5-carboxymethylaminomethyl modifying enzyme MnmG/GidA
LDYQNGDQALQTALDKFKDYYNAAKSKSILRLSSFLYDFNHDLDPMARIKSGAHIRVQVESIKRRKTEGGGSKQRLPAPTSEEKKNLDPQTIPARKKRKTTKKEHNLCKNILNNHPN